MRSSAFTFAAPRPVQVASPALPVRRWPERRAVVLGVAAAGFAGIFALRMTTADVDAGIGLLLALPVALVALELGLLAGVGAAALATALVIAWSTTSGADIGPVGLATRAGVFFVVGALAGRFSDRMREAGRRQRRLLDSGLALAHLGDARELPAGVARWAHDLVGADGVRVELLDDRAAEIGEIGPAPVVVPVSARGRRLGELAVSRSRPLSPEDHAALAALAIQAAIAGENQRLLAAAQERAALEAQLTEARQGLGRRSHQLREVLAGQEDERQALAFRLHEDTAQAMAAILLGLRALDRDLDSGAVRPRLDALRSHVDATLADLRNLAVSLRPPVLDLGLEVALGRLGEQYRVRGLECLDVSLDGALDGLGRDAETALYRVVEDALDAYEDPACAAIEVNGDELLVTVRGHEGSHARPERVATVGARVELLGGTLHANAELRVRVPLGAQRTV